MEIFYCWEPERKMDGSIRCDKTLSQLERDRSKSRFESIVVVKSKRLVELKSSLSLEPLSSVVMFDE